MGMKDYYLIIERWRKIYGQPPIIYNADPTQVRTGCGRCNKIRQRMSRHHIENDFFFAQLMPDQFALRYITFHPNDVIRLCNRCHRSIHEYMFDTYVQMLNDVDNFYKLRTDEERIKWCNSWKVKYRILYTEWMARYRPRLQAKREAKSGKRKSRRKRFRKDRSKSGDTKS